jgi:branched-chain amino acid transport system substrate-binding protein
MRAWSRGVVVVVVLALAGCTTGGSGPEPVGGGEVRIGVLAALSGDDPGVGQEMVRGAQLAAELINDGALRSMSGASLPDGMRVTIASGDTKNDADTGIESALRLVDDERVAALIGEGSPAVMAATSERTERLGVPFIGADPTADFLTERGLAWFFRTGPTERSLAATLFSVVRQQAAKERAAKGTGATRVAIVYPAGRDAADLATLLSELAGEGSFDLATMVGVDLETDGPARPEGPAAPPNGPAAQLDNAVSKVQAERPGAVFLVAPTMGEAKALVKRFRRLSDPVTLLGFGAGFTDPGFEASAGKDAAGLLYPTAWSYALAQRSPTVEPILRAYFERHGRRMSEAAASGFTAVQSVVEAAARARSADRGQLRTALLGLDLTGRATIMPWEGIRFDGSGQNVQAVGIVEQRTANAVQIVFPPGVADGAALPLSRAGR